MAIVLLVLTLLVAALTLLAPLGHAPGIAPRPTAVARPPAAGAAPPGIPGRSAVPAPRMPAAPNGPAPTPAPPPQASITLRHGDTLWALAQRYHTTVAALQQINGLGTSTLIYAGHTLRVSADGGQSTPLPAQRHGTNAHAASYTDAGAPAPGAAAAVAFARAQLGRPYVWGAAGPNGFDCSGLVMRAWQAGGVQLPRTTYEQARVGTHTTRTTRAALAPGDLIFTDDFGHVELYTGNAQVIYAPHSGARVTTDRVPPDAAVDAYIHIS